MIVGSSLTIEIGDRTLLARRLVRRGHRREGRAGRPQRRGQVVARLGVRRGGPAHRARHRGACAVPGTVGFLPQVPGARGARARRHRLLPRALGPGTRRARRRAQPGPAAVAKDPTAENIAAVLRPRGAVPGERGLRGRGGRWPGWPTGSACARTCCSTTSTASREASGAGSTSSGCCSSSPTSWSSTSRPTTSTSPAKRWLMDELEQLHRGPARHQPRPQAPRPVHHQGAAPGRRPRCRSTRGPTPATGPSWRRPGASGRRVGHPGGPRDPAAHAPWPTPCGAAPTAGPGSPSRSTAGWSGWRRPATEVVTSASARPRFRLPDPARSGERSAHASRDLVGRLRPTTGAPRRHLRRRPGRPGGGHRPQRGRQVEPAALPGRGPGADGGRRWSSGPTWPSATSPRSTSRSTRTQPPSTTSTTPCSRPRPSGGPCSGPSGCRASPPTRCRPPCPAASGPSSAWPCWPPVRPTCSSSTSRPTTSTPPRSWPWATMLSGWPGTIVAVSHDRAFVEALAPDPRPAAARRAVHALARGVPRRRRAALTTCDPRTAIAPPLSLRPRGPRREPADRRSVTRAPGGGTRARSIRGWRWG